MAHTRDQIHAARLGANGQYVVLAGLIGVAVGCELVVAHPGGSGSAALGLLLFGGAFLYVAAQTWYLTVTMQRRASGRVLGLAILLAGVGVGVVRPPLASLVVLAAVLIWLAASVTRDRGTPSSR